MAYREITDPDGRAWRVWNTEPHQFTGRHVIAAEYASGWLTFETDDEKRRVAPAPTGWDALDNTALLRLLVDAKVIGPRVKRLAEAAGRDVEHGDGRSG